MFRIGLYAPAFRAMFHHENSPTFYALRPRLLYRRSAIATPGRTAPIHLLSSRLPLLRPELASIPQPLVTSLTPFTGRNELVRVGGKESSDCLRLTLFPSVHISLHYFTNSGLILVCAGHLGIHSQ